MLSFCYLKIIKTNINIYLKTSSVLQHSLSRYSKKVFYIIRTIGKENDLNTQEKKINKSKLLIPQGILDRSSFLMRSIDRQCTGPLLTGVEAVLQSRLCKIASHYYTNIPIQLEKNLGEFMAFMATHSK